MWPRLRSFVTAFTRCEQFEDTLSDELRFHVDVYAADTRFSCATRPLTGRLETDHPAADLFLHTEMVLLVDDRGRLRGVYNGSMPFEVAKLIEDIDTLTTG